MQKPRRDSNPKINGDEFDSIISHEKFQRQKSFDLEHHQIFSSSTARKHLSGDFLGSARE